MKKYVSRVWRCRSLRRVAGQRLVQEGLEAALQRKQQVRPSVERIFDGHKEAQLIAIACGSKPARTTRHEGYAVSQRCRKKVEEIFGWMKTIGGFRRTRYRGRDRTGLCAYLAAAAYIWCD